MKIINEDRAKLADMIRKGNLKHGNLLVGDNASEQEIKVADEYDSEFGFEHAEDGDTSIQFQDREMHTHHPISNYNYERSPRVKSNTWGRIWKNGTLEKVFEGPKYEVRQEMAKYLDDTSESLEEGDNNMKHHFIKEAIDNIDRVDNMNGNMPVVMADAKEDSEKNDKKAKQALEAGDKEVKAEPFIGAEKQSLPVMPEMPKIILDESLFEDYKSSTPYKDLFWDLIEDDMINVKEIAKDLVYWLSEDDCKHFMQIHDLDSFFPDYNEENECLKESMKEDDDNDGWSEEIQARCEDLFRKVEDLAYEIRNCVRGSYVVDGESTSDLVTKLNEISEDAEDVASDLDSDSKELDEQFIGAKKLYQKAESIADDISEFLNDASKISNISDYLDEADMDRIVKSLDALYDFAQDYSYVENPSQLDENKNKKVDSINNELSEGRVSGNDDWNSLDDIDDSSEDLFDLVYDELSVDINHEANNRKISNTDYKNSKRFRFDDEIGFDRNDGPKKIGDNHKDRRNAKIEDNKFILYPNNDEQKEFAKKVAELYKVPIEINDDRIIITVPETKIADN